MYRHHNISKLERKVYLLLMILYCVVFSIHSSPFVYISCICSSRFRNGQLVPKSTLHNSAASAATAIVTHIPVSATLASGPGSSPSVAAAPSAIASGRAAAFSSVGVPAQHARAPVSAAPALTAKLTTAPAAKLNAIPNADRATAGSVIAKASIAQQHSAAQSTAGCNSSVSSSSGSGSGSSGDKIAAARARAAALLQSLDSAPEPDSDDDIAAKNDANKTFARGGGFAAGMDDDDDDIDAEFGLTAAHTAAVSSALSGASDGGGGGDLASRLESLASALKQKQGY